MRLIDIKNFNKEAVSAANTFRQTITPKKKGVIDDRFHKCKNHFPYFGMVRVNVGDNEFAMFSSNDDLVAMVYFWYGADSYEPMSLTLWSERAKRANIVLDVGSFTGVYSLLAAECNANSTIYAIEAARRTYGRLLSNVQINKATNRIKCINKAASNKEGHEMFLRFRGENILGIGDSFIQKDVKAIASEERVITTRIDTLCNEMNITPDLIKIGVEGAEILVLEGMQNILDEARADIIIEVTPKTAQDVYDILSKHKYKVRLIDERNMSVSQFDGKVNRVCNLLAEAF